jgi:hypothetical protein
METMSEFTCDEVKPEARRGVCGKPAEFFHDGGMYHRPLCSECAAARGTRLVPYPPISVVDPAKVPFSCGGFVDDRPDREDPPVGHSGPPPPLQPLSRPPLREAFADLATALLLKGQEVIEDWRRR